MNSAPTTLADPLLGFTPRCETPFRCDRAIGAKARFMQTGEGGVPESAPLAPEPR